MRTFILVVAIFIGFWFSFVNIAKLVRGHRIPWMNVAIMAAALTVITTYYLKIW